MTEYFLHCDEPYWVTTVWNEEMTELNADREITDIMDDTVSYYWITSTEREEVLKVADFIDGEDIITELQSDDEDEVNTFEEAVEKYEYAEIRDERPPQ